jgi:hypothetical protein
MPPSWQERLANTFTETELVELARDFLSQFSSYEISALPEACRPTKLTEANDITEFAFVLVRHHCDNGEAQDYTVHRLTYFFSSASVRLSQVVHAQSQGANEDKERQLA